MKRVFTALAFLFLTQQAFAMQTDEFSSFIKQIRNEAMKNGIDKNILDVALPANTKFISKLIERSKPKNQTQSKLSFSTYTKRLVSDNRIKTAKEKYKNNYITLQKISAKYGIPKEVIVALWGIESNFGKSMGNYNIVPSLATLAYGSHRKDFFKKELLYSLQILQEGHIDPKNLKGSWAGAMGQCQFMPSSFIELAADGNGDGKKNIWSDNADVFASAANYLKSRGWQTNKHWGQQVILTKFLPANFEINKQGLSIPLNIKQWKKLGVMPKHGYNDYKGEKASLFIPEGPSGKAYLVYNNFRTIMRWNNSTSFAFSVLTLAEKIKLSKKEDK